MNSSSRAAEIVNNILDGQEESRDNGALLISALVKKVEEYDIPQKLVIQTHLGDQELKIVEWWWTDNGKVLHVGVENPPAP